MAAQNLSSQHGGKKLRNLQMHFNYDTTENEKALETSNIRFHSIRLLCFRDGLLFYFQ